MCVSAARCPARSGEAGSAESQGRGDTANTEEPTMANNTRQNPKILNNPRLFENLNLINGMGVGQGTA
jgi:hypothetical protein